MAKHLRFILFFVVIFLSNKIFAQFYSTGQEPANVKWSQINTSHFQVLFDCNYEAEAQLIANILEGYYHSASQSLDHQPQKITVIVHNQTIRSNGYVSWAPKRMELYTTPSQDLLPEPWLEHLCVHELRHVVQIDKLNQGITKILSVLFGQMAVGMTAGQLPMWYYEGDAVCTETAFGKFGRGRSPAFEKNIKTHLLSDEKWFTFDQMLFGSYNQYVPNHYEFGYQLTAYLRIKYGTKAVSSAHNFVARNSYSLLPTPVAFSVGLKKQTGLNHKQLYDETFNFLDSVYTEKEERNQSIRPNPFQQYKIKQYEDYVNPVSFDTNQVIVLKEGLNHIPQFVLVSPENETVIIEPGILVSDDFSVAKKFLVWAEFKPHFRWQNKEYSTIKMMNIETKKTRTVVLKSRYFSPDISPDANKIVVIEVTPDNQYFLTVISSFNGDVHYRIPSPNFIMRPKWTSDSKSIYLIELTDKGKQVSTYSFENKSWEMVMQSENADIQRIIPSNSYLFSHSTKNGNDEVCVFDLLTKEKYQISLSASGITDFCIDKNDKDIIVAEYSSQGNRLGVIPIERGLWKILDTKQNNMTFSEALTEQESVKDKIEKLPSVKHTVRPYNKLLNTFNFHSWIPFYFDYSNETLNGFLTDPEKLTTIIHPGIMLLSQSKLSTTEAVVAYAYKNGHHYIESSLIYKGLLPVIKFSANYGDLHQYFASLNTTWFPRLSYNDFSYNLDIYIPINISSGNMVGGFIPRLNIDFQNSYYYNYVDDYYISGNTFFNEQIIFYWLKRTSKRDIQPRSGLSVDITLFNTPLENKLFGFMANIDGTVYLPGFFKNHGVKLNAGYQFQEPEMYLFTTNFSFPHGITEFRTEKLSKFYFNYVFPIAYPDWSIGPVAYIKRIKGDFFFNYANNRFRAIDDNTNSVFWTNYNLVSYGIEISVDYHLLRMIFPLNTGVRVGYTNYSNSIFSELIFGINISQL
ncbi:MAG: hypothetical protein AB7S50_05830 [Bacteroidales bacterium]